MRSWQTDAEDLEGVKSLLDKNSKMLEQIFAAYTAPTPRSHSRLHAKAMDFQRLLVVAKDFELVPTIVDKQRLSELYERICTQSQVAPQVGISAKGFMELLGVMALVSGWLRDVAGLHTATDRVRYTMRSLFAGLDSQRCGMLCCGADAGRAEAHGFGERKAESWIAAELDNWQPPCSVNVVIVA